MIRESYQPPVGLVTAEEQKQAVTMLKRSRVAVFIVAYNAEKYLQSVLARIPAELLSNFAEIFVIDDRSTDSTFEVATKLKEAYAGFPISVYRTPFNRGYGGNQKLGYLYCIRKNFDYVILLHGDGQYAPEFLPRLLAAFEEETDAVFASRMINRRMALQGGMPFYKWIGNQVLTALENRILGIHLSEFHTGLRAYRVASLQKVPFTHNSDDFHFDTEIIIQAVAMNWKIREVGIPTHYGDEECHVNGLKYAFHCLGSVVSYRLVNLGLFYRRNFDFGLFETNLYQFKRSPNSLHQYVLKHGDFGKDLRSVELGANRGILSSHIAEKVTHHVAVDFHAPDMAGTSIVVAADLNQDFSKTMPGQQYDRCIALDVVEHMNEPEHFLTEAFNLMKAHGRIYISTANIGYLPIRISLLLGQFNYGKRGILDRTHKRLFSVGNFKSLLRQYGFHVEKVRGFAPPLSDLVSAHPIMKMLEKIHSLLSRFWPTLFGYNFLVVATRMDGIEELLQRTTGSDSAEAETGSPRNI